jgi:ribonuclease BN (tRNA processing enzyme)
MLGIGPSYPGPGETGSGFLVQEGKTNLLVDCGNGILGILQKFIHLRTITDIFISHMHADHFFDLIPYRYALYYGKDKSSAVKPRLHLPPEGVTVLGQIVDYFSDSDSFFADTFMLSEYEAGNTIRLPDFDLIPTKVRHYIASYGVSMIGVHKAAYSSDSGECEGLRGLAKDADFFICNVGNSLEPGKANSWGHIGPEQAGMLAAESGVKWMLISHLRPDFKKEQYLKKTALYYQGNLELARSGTSYELTNLFIK